MFNPLTGEYTVPARNIVRERIESENVAVHVAFEDGKFSCYYVYVVGYLGKDFRTAKAAVAFAMKRGAKLTVAQLEEAKGQVEARVAAGEVNPEWQAQQIAIQGFDAMNDAIRAEYAEKGITDLVMVDNAVTRVVERTETMTTLAFYDGHTRTIGNQYL